METTQKQAAQRIVATMRDLQSKRINPDEARQRMGQIKAQAGEATYRAAHTSAVVHLARS